jgi:hypothetical protein
MSDNTIIEYVCNTYQSIDHICFINKYDPDMINFDNLLKAYIQVCYQNIDYAFDTNIQTIYFISMNKINGISDIQQNISLCNVYL